MLELKFVLQMKVKSYPIIKRQVRSGLTNAGTFLLSTKKLNDRSVEFVTFFYADENMKYLIHNLCISLFFFRTVFVTLQVKGKAIPLQAWTGPEGSKSSRLPDFKAVVT